MCLVPLIFMADSHAYWSRATSGGTTSAGCRTAGFCPATFVAVAARRRHYNQPAAESSDREPVQQGKGGEGRDAATRWCCVPVSVSRALPLTNAIDANRA